jgi:hypothetical protein
VKAIITMTVTTSFAKTSVLKCCPPKGLAISMINLRQPYS